MKATELRRRLRDAPIPDEHDARERGWRVVQAAYAERRPATAPTSSPRRLAVVLVAAAIVLAVVLTPAGAKVVDLVDDAVSPGARHAQPTLTHLPGGGSLLVESTNGPWVVNADGSKRVLGEYDEAAWSAGGRFVAVTAGHELRAVEPTATDAVRWSIPSERPVTHPSWSTSGVRVAYLSGHSLRVVAGDGTGDHLLARRVAPVTPEWRPQARPLPPDAIATGPGTNVLAYVSSSKRVVVVDSNTGEVLFRSADRPRPEGLSWSANGKLLLTFTGRDVRTYDFASRVRRPTFVGMPEGMTLRSVVFQPGTNRVAAIATQSGRSRPRGSLFYGKPDVESFPSERLFAGPGRFTDLAWSPEGDWLLVAWPDADQWLFLDPKTGRVMPVGDITGQFDAGAASSVPFPRVAGWCCTPLGTNSP